MPLFAKTVPLLAILEWCDRQFQSDKKWRERSFSTHLLHDQPKVRIYLYGITHDDPPRYFMVHTDIPRTDLQKADNTVFSLVESHFANLVVNLDSFLDAQCKCVPGPNGQPGPHCAYHRELYGH